MSRRCAVLEALTPQVSRSSSAMSCAESSAARAGWWLNASPVIALITSVDSERNP
ncbi:hypothetical protein JQ615_07290 [Bradyrhizobium jicamae]|uniref:Uncharacterized protein n=1 Tax=Bradyrhizobium jicamae TaxID=280332 RepID=A0ABS5FEF1_9BRAD|nr:hypothetical protein [Bradyrhizobium jicamae]MBR0795186.1 hypothetical protein [Bradyrhizobium jicamae]